MKQVNSILLMLIISLLFSCSSDDSNEPEISILEQNKINIIGIWAPTSSIIENGTGESELDECYLTERYEFKSDNILDITENYGLNCSELDEYSISYSITETHLDFDIDPQEIIELTPTTLKLIFIEDGIRYIDTYAKQ